MYRFASGRAREEGLSLLRFLSSNFEKRFPYSNFEGIQNEEVAKAIVKFEAEVAGTKLKSLLTFFLFK